MLNQQRSANFVSPLMNGVTFKTISNKRKEMSSNEHPAESNYCPICKTLPLNTLEYGVECPPLEYHIRSDDIDINSDNDKQFDKCALYYSVTSLKRIWSGKAEFPAEHIPERWSRAYTCAGSNSVTVLTDPHAPLGMYSYS